MSQSSLGFGNGLERFRVCLASFPFPIPVVSIGIGSQIDRAATPTNHVSLFTARRTMGRTSSSDIGTTSSATPSDIRSVCVPRFPDPSFPTTKIPPFRPMTIAITAGITFRPRKIVTFTRRTKKRGIRDSNTVSQ